MKQFFRSLHLNWTDTLVSIFGSAFLAFGLYNVHALSGVTEGGVLGLTLLLDHWFSISPSVSGAILNVLCYAMGWKLLGRRFLAYSFISTASFSLSYMSSSRRCFRKLRTIRCLPRWSARSLSAWAQAYVSARAARRAETTRWQ